MDWKTESRILYKAGLKISDIAEKVGKSRKTVSGYLNQLPDLAAIKRTRTEQAAEKRREYKRNWKRQYDSMATATMLRRQHEIDVRVLSAERYFDE